MAKVSWGAVVAMIVCSAMAETDPRDVEALRKLYFSLNLPYLERWVPVGGDPCGEQWQGVMCVFSNVTHLILSDANLGGTLGDSLSFPSLLHLDLSNNRIRGTIPSLLPPTLTNLSLSRNALQGTLPDSFAPLSSLQSLHLCNNRLSGPLPPSLSSLSSLSSLDLSNNRLTGLLDLLQPLPLRHLNVENNLFSGPIPLSLFNIPDFLKEGNPFNTSLIHPPPPPFINPPSPVSLLPPPSTPVAPEDLFLPPPPAIPPPELGTYPTLPDTPSVPYSSWMPNGSPRRGNSSDGVNMVLVTGIAIAVVAAIVICVLMPLCCKRKKQLRDDSEIWQTPKWEKPKVEKAPEVPKREEPRNRDSVRQKKAPAPVIPPAGKIATAIPPAGKITTAIPLGKSNVKQTLPPLKPFTMATLQQWTRNFSKDTFVGEGMIGTIYRAKHPNGTLLAVKKLKASPSVEKAEEFDKILVNLSRLQHPNVLGIIGYCNEQSERSLVFNFCKKGSLHDALHLHEDIRRKLDWTARMKIGIGAAKALEYLHEICQPLVVHRNFRSVNILLDDKFEAVISECGLESLVPCNRDGIPIQGPDALGYAAPELELGIYTTMSDIYSYGVVLLELLTAKKSYDRTRNRGAQSLVRWAVPRLHDIDALSRMVDPALKGSFSSKYLSRYADIVSRCIQWEPEFRPKASELVQDLLNLG